MKVYRQDICVVKATRSDDGFIHDSPVITRTGVFPYANPDGSIRYELRLPEEVFKQDSLDSLRGIPLTNGHIGKANSKNTHANVGAVLSVGRRDGDNLVADIVIHNTEMVDAGVKELSCGYECELDETSGVWNGQKYDAIQRNIRHNHLALVPKGRAGNAKLNLDAADDAAFFTPENKEISMKTIRLDNGLEYDAAPEVVVAFDKLKQDAVDAVKAKDKAEAERDAVQADLKALQDKQAEVISQAQQQAKDRIKLEAEAEAVGVDIKEDSADRDLKIAIIQKIRQDSVDYKGKSDDYVQAAFDLAMTEKDKRKREGNAQAQSMRQDAAQNGTQVSVSAAQARYNMIHGDK